MNWAWVKFDRIESNLILAVRTHFLKVILNVDAITHPLTGIGQYTWSLGQQLQQASAVDAVRFFSADHWVDDLNHSVDDNQWLSRLRQWVPFKALALNAYGSRRARKFKQLSRDFQDHVFHSPNFILMPFEGQSVATFHDLSFVHYRETQPQYRLQYLDREIPKTLDQADAIITPTEFIKQEVIDCYGYPADKIQVTPLGVHAGFKPHSAKTCATTLQKHLLKHRQFILSVATTEPRKNLARLLSAYAQLPSTLKQAYPLVLVGSQGWLNQELNQQIKQAVSQGHITTLGYVSQPELQHLYASATLTALPSLYEGFGLPIIESMASATPVLTSQNSAMQEVAGGHAMLCDPLDTESIQQSLQQAIEDNQWQQQASQAGLKHSQKFNWQHCAEKTLQAYYKAEKQ